MTLFFLFFHVREAHFPPSEILHFYYIILKRFLKIFIIFFRHKFTKIFTKLLFIFKFSVKFTNALDVVFSNSLQYPHAVL